MKEEEEEEQSRPITPRTCARMRTCYSCQDIHNILTFNTCFTADYHDELHRATHPPTRECKGKLSFLAQ